MTEDDASMRDDRETLAQIVNRRYEDELRTKKPQLYVKAYEEQLSAFREKSFGLLELGVYSGASLLVWKEYFPFAEIAGLDTLPCPESLKDQDNIKFVQGDQSESGTLDALASSVRAPIHLIIDDASHIGELSQKSFDYLFRYLASGGVYVIEDWGASLKEGWPDFSSPAAFRDAKAGYGAGMPAMLKRVLDHLIMSDPATGTKHPIANMVIYPHIAFVWKS